MKIENKYLLQILTLFEKASKRKGCSKIRIWDIDAYNGSLWNGREVTCDGNIPTMFSMPFDFSNFVEMLVQENNVRGYENLNSVSLSIDFEKREVRIVGSFTEYGEDSQGESEYDFSEEFEKELLDYLVDNDFEGAQSVIINFNGGGDDGYLESEISVIIGNDSTSVLGPAFIDNTCYDILNTEYGGWENNEGGFGSFNISPSEKVIRLNFIYNTEDSVDDILEILTY